MFNKAAMNFEKQQFFIQFEWIIFEFEHNESKILKFIDFNLKY